MARASPLVSVITDEISPVLDEALAFVAEEGLTSIDLRMVDRVNFMGLSPEAMRDAARRIRAAGLTVDCLATPLLKWPGPGQPFELTGDQFGFDPRERGIDEAYATAFRAAEVFGARRLRIFSYMTYPTFALVDLRAPIDRLLALAERHDREIVIENEPVCNVATIADLAACLAAYDHPRLGAVLDLGNAYCSRAAPTEAELRAVAPRVSIVHIKDFAAATGRYVPLGEGDVPFDRHLHAVLATPGAGNPPLVVETHARDDKANVTRASLAATRALARRLTTRLATHS